MRMSSPAKHNLFVLFLLLTGWLTGRALAETTHGHPAPKAGSQFLKLPLYFEPAEGGDFTSRQGKNRITIGDRGMVQFLAPGRLPLEMSLVGASKSKPSGEQVLSGRTNYFLGNDSAKWRRQVAQFASTRVSDVYDGIDLVYYGNGSELEHDYIVAPGANTANISLSFQNGSARLDGKTGDLLLQPQSGDSIRMRRPIAYQLGGDGVRQPVTAAFARRDDGNFGFALGSYDHKRQLIIDPVILYSTFFGGSNYDSVVDLKTDATGDIYFLMATQSVDLPQKGGPSGICPVGCGPTSTGSPLDYTYSDLDFYVAKMDAFGQTLDFATYIGGSGSDIPANLGLDADGNIYVAGTSYSPDFPTFHAYQTSPSPVAPGPRAGGSQSGVLAKLSADGSTLLYSTYLGYGLPDAGDGVYSIEDILSVDKAGVVYLLEAAADAGQVPGQTPILVTQPMKNSLYKEGVSFLAKVDTTRSGDDSLIYASLIGDDSQPDKYVTPLSIGTDSKGNLWMYGLSRSSSFPITSAASFQPDPPPLDAVGSAFLLELNPAGTAPLYGTWLAGKTRPGDGLAIIFPSDMTLDSADNIYVTGTTDVMDYPLVNAAYGPSDIQKAESLGSFNAPYLSKLAPGGKQLLYSTFYFNNDYGNEIANYGYFIHGTPSGPIVVGGFSDDSVFLQKNPLPQAQLSALRDGNRDGVFSVFDSTQAGANSLMIASRLGSTSGFTTVTQAILDGDGKFVVLGGSTNATDLPVVSPFQATCNPQNCNSSNPSHSISDGFLMRIQALTNFSITPTSLTFESTAVGASSMPQTAIITNATSVAINLSLGTLTDATDFSSTTDCAETLPPGTSCNVTFTFSPKAGGALTSTYSIADLNDPSNPLQVALSGTATGGYSAALSPGTIDFMSVAVGTSSSSAVTLTNSGVSALAITSATVTGTGFTLAQSQCGTSLAANSSCQLTVTVSPTSAGELSGALTVVDAAGTQTVQLMANGMQGVSGQVTLLPNALNFANVPPGQTTGFQMLTLANNTNAPLTFNFSQIAVSGPDAASFQRLVGSCDPNNGCTPTYGATDSSFVVNPSGIFVLAVRMLNDAQDLKTYSADVAINWTYVGAPSGTPPMSLFATLTGNTLVPVMPSVTPSTLSFPVTANGGRSAAQTVVVSNTGDAPLGLTSITLNGANPGAFIQSNSCPKSFNKGDTCTISVVFAPGSTGTSFMANLDVSLSTGDVNIPITGYSTTSEFSITSPTPVPLESFAYWEIDLAPVDASVGWNQPITLTSSGLDPNIFGTPTFSVNPVTPGHGKVAIGVKLVGGPDQNSNLRRPGSNAPKELAVLACLTLLIPVVRSKSLRHLRVLLTLVCLAAGGLMLQGCTDHTQYFTVTATSGSISHSIQLAFAY